MNCRFFAGAALLAALVLASCAKVSYSEQILKVTVEAVPQKLFFGESLLKVRSATKFYVMTVRASQRLDALRAGDEVEVAYDPEGASTLLSVTSTPAGAEVSEGQPAQGVH